MSQRLVEICFNCYRGPLQKHQVAFSSRFLESKPRRIVRYKKDKIQLYPIYNPFHSHTNCDNILINSILILKDIEKQEGYQSWIVGIVEKGQRTARIIDKPRVIEVPGKEKDEELW